MSLELRPLVNIESKLSLYSEYYKLLIYIHIFLLLLRLGSIGSKVSMYIVFINTIFNTGIAIYTSWKRPSLLSL